MRFAQTLMHRAKVSRAKKKVLTEVEFVAAEVTRRTLLAGMIQLKPRMDTDSHG